MDRATISRIEAWDTRSVSGGYVGLNELADDEFTGVVSAEGAHLFMLNGRVVGVENGSVSSFEDADVTAYESPDPALPLLFAMQDHGGEVRGSYYTDDTPIREVDQTLTEGGFTGYLELSENVLSGDYYVVYYGGRSLAAAFVGNKGRVVTGDEAFDLAADEVGIYEVTAVDLEVAEVPEPPDVAVAAGGAEVEEPADEGAAPDEEPAVEAEPVDDEDAVTEEATDEGDVDEAPTEEPADEPAEEATEPDEEATAVEDEPAEAGTEPDGEADDGAEILDAEDDAAVAATDASAGTEPAEGGSTAEAATGGGTAADAGPAKERPRREGAGSEPDERFEEEARWREARTVPALDPEESTKPQEERRPTEPEPRSTPEPTPEPAAGGGEVQALEERLERLETKLESNERERRRLDEDLSAVADERDALAEERDQLVERVERLEERLEAAQSAVASADEGSGRSTGAATGGERVDPETALDQTDLFVRYGSKGKPTLETAHDGRASAEEVAENLRIDSHSRFDAARATVDGRAFDDFLTGTIQYRFVSWLVEVLLYEIRDTGTENGLRALYDVLPEIDRAEFNGTVETTDEEGESHTEAFDVVCRNRMGKPLIVANINDSLDPATGDMMGTLVEDATSAAESNASIGAAFLVTASFFQPDALETADAATRGGGFLSRDSKKSFVKLSRSGGYHLCLVEARGDDFHVAVPEF